MADIDSEIAAYEKLKEKLESEHTGKWVLVYQSALEGVYDSFDDAAQDAVKRYKNGPYLIRQVGAPPISLPASVMYRVAQHG